MASYTLLRRVSLVLVAKAHDSYFDANPIAELGELNHHDRISTTSGISKEHLAHLNALTSLIELESNLDLPNSLLETAVHTHIATSSKKTGLSSQLQISAESSLGSKSSLGSMLTSKSRDTPNSYAIEGVGNGPESCTEANLAKIGNKPNMQEICWGGAIGKPFRKENKNQKDVAMCCELCRHGADINPFQVKDWQAECKHRQSLYDHYGAGFSRYLRRINWNCPAGKDCTCKAVSEMDLKKLDGCRYHDPKKPDAPAIISCEIDQRRCSQLSPYLGDQCHVKCKDGFVLAMIPGGHQGTSFQQKNGKNKENEKKQREEHGKLFGGNGVFPSARMSEPEPFTCSAMLRTKYSENVELVMTGGNIVCIKERHCGVDAIKKWNNLKDNPYMIKIPSSWEGQDENTPYMVKRGDHAEFTCNDGTMKEGVYDYIGKHGEDQDGYDKSAPDIAKATKEAQVAEAKASAARHEAIQKVLGGRESSASLSDSSSLIETSLDVPYGISPLVDESWSAGTQVGTVQCIDGNFPHWRDVFLKLEYSTCGVTCEQFKVGMASNGSTSFMETKDLSAISRSSSGRNVGDLAKLISELKVSSGEPKTISVYEQEQMDKKKAFSMDKKTSDSNSSKKPDKPHETMVEHVARELKEKQRDADENIDAVAANLKEKQQDAVPTSKQSSSASTDDGSSLVSDVVADTKAPRLTDKQTKFPTADKSDKFPTADKSSKSGLTDMTDNKQINHQVVDYTSGHVNPFNQRAQCVNEVRMISSAHRMKALHSGKGPKSYQHIPPGVIPSFYLRCRKVNNDKPEDKQPKFAKNLNSKITTYHEITHREDFLGIPEECRKGGKYEMRLFQILIKDSDSEKESQVNILVRGGAKLDEAKTLYGKIHRAQKPLAEGIFYVNEVYTEFPKLYDTAVFQFLKNSHSRYANFSPDDLSRMYRNDVVATIEGSRRNDQITVADVEQQNLWVTHPALMKTWKGRELAAQAYKKKLEAANAEKAGDTISSLMAEDELRDAEDAIANFLQQHQQQKKKKNIGASSFIEVGHKVGSKSLGKKMNKIRSRMLNITGPQGLFGPALEIEMQKKNRQEDYGELAGVLSDSHPYQEEASDSLNKTEGIPPSASSVRSSLMQRINTSNSKSGEEKAEESTNEEKTESFEEVLKHDQTMQQIAKINKPLAEEMQSRESKVIIPGSEELLKDPKKNDTWTPEDVQRTKQLVEDAEAARDEIEHRGKDNLKIAVKTNKRVQRESPLLKGNATEFNRQADHTSEGLNQNITNMARKLRGEVSAVKHLEEMMRNISNTTTEFSDLQIGGQKDTTEFSDFQTGKGSSDLEIGKVEHDSIFNKVLSDAAYLDSLAKADSANYRKAESASLSEKGKEIGFWNDLDPANGAAIAAAISTKLNNDEADLDTNERLAQTVNLVADPYAVIAAGKELRTETDKDAKQEEAANTDGQQQTLAFGRNHAAGDEQEAKGNRYGNFTDDSNTRQQTHAARKVKTMDAEKVEMNADSQINNARVVESEKAATEAGDDSMKVAKSNAEMAKRNAKKGTDVANVLNKSAKQLEDTVRVRVQENNALTENIKYKHKLKPKRALLASMADTAYSRGSIKDGIADGVSAAANEGVHGLQFGGIPSEAYQREFNALMSQNTAFNAQRFSSSSFLQLDDFTLDTNGLDTNGLDSNSDLNSDSKDFSSFLFHTEIPKVQAEWVIEDQKSISLLEQIEKSEADEEKRLDEIMNVKLDHHVHAKLDDNTTTSMITNGTSVTNSTSITNGTSITNATSLLSRSETKHETKEPKEKLTAYCHGFEMSRSSNPSIISKQDSISFAETQKMQKVSSMASLAEEIDHKFGKKESILCQIKDVNFLTGTTILAEQPILPNVVNDPDSDQIILSSDLDPHARQEDLEHLYNLALTRKRQGFDINGKSSTVIGLSDSKPNNKDGDSLNFLEGGVVSGFDSALEANVLSSADKLGLENPKITPSTIVDDPLGDGLNLVSRTDDTKTFADTSSLMESSDPISSSTLSSGTGTGEFDSFSSNFSPVLDSSNPVLRNAISAPADWNTGTGLTTASLEIFPSSFVERLQKIRRKYNPSDVGNQDVVNRGWARSAPRYDEDAFNGDEPMVSDISTNQIQMANQMASRDNFLNPTMSDSESISLLSKQAQRAADYAANTNKYGAHISSIKMEEAAKQATSSTHSEKASGVAPEMKIAESTSVVSAFRSPDATFTNNRNTVGNDVMNTRLGATPPLAIIDLSQNTYGPGLDDQEDFKNVMDSFSQDVLASQEALSSKKTSKLNKASQEADRIDRMMEGLLVNELYDSNSGAYYENPIEFELKPMDEIFLKEKKDLSQVMCAHKCHWQFYSNADCAHTELLWTEYIWERLFADPRLTKAILEWKVHQYKQKEYARRAQSPFTRKSNKPEKPLFCAKDFANPLFLKGVVKAGSAPIPFAHYLEQMMSASLETHDRRAQAEAELDGLSSKPKTSETLKARWRDLQYERGEDARPNVSGYAETAKDGVLHGLYGDSQLRRIDRTTVAQSSIETLPEPPQGSMETLVGLAGALATFRGGVAGLYMSSNVDLLASMNMKTKKYIGMLTRKASAQMRNGSNEFRYRLTHLKKIIDYQTKRVGKWKEDALLQPDDGQAAVNEMLTALEDAETLLDEYEVHAAEQEEKEEAEESEGSHGSDDGANNSFISVFRKKDLLDSSKKIGSAVEKSNGTQQSNYSLTKKAKFASWAEALKAKPWRNFTQRGQIIYGKRGEHQHSKEAMEQKEEAQKLGNTDASAVGASLTQLARRGTGKDSGSADESALALTEVEKRNLEKKAGTAAFMSAFGEHRDEILQAMSEASTQWEHQLYIRGKAIQEKIMNQVLDYEREREEKERQEQQDDPLPSHSLLESNVVNADTDSEAKDSEESNFRDEIESKFKAEMEAFEDFQKSTTLEEKYSLPENLKGVISPAVFAKFTQVLANSAFDSSDEKAETHKLQRELLELIQNESGDNESSSLIESPKGEQSPDDKDHISSESVAEKASTKSSTNLVAEKSTDEGENKPKGQATMTAGRSPGSTAGKGGEETSESLNEEYAMEAEHIVEKMQLAYDSVYALLSQSEHLPVQELNDVSVCSYRHNEDEIARHVTSECSWKSAVYQGKCKVHCMKGYAEVKDEVQYSYCQLGHWSEPAGQLECRADCPNPVYIDFGVHISYSILNEKRLSQMEWRRNGMSTRAGSAKLSETKSDDAGYVKLSDLLYMGEFANFGKEIKKTTHKATALGTSSESDSSESDSEFSGFNNNYNAQITVSNSPVGSDMYHSRHGASLLMSCDRKFKARTPKLAKNLYECLNGNWFAVEPADPHMRAIAYKPQDLIQPTCQSVCSWDYTNGGLNARGYKSQCSFEMSVNPMRLYDQGDACRIECLTYDDQDELNAANTGRYVHASCQQTKDSDAATFVFEKKRAVAIRNMKTKNREQARKERERLEAESSYDEEASPESLSCITPEEWLAKKAMEKSLKDKEDSKKDSSYEEEENDAEDNNYIESTDAEESSVETSDGGREIDDRSDGRETDDRSDGREIDDRSDGGDNVEASDDGRSDSGDNVSENTGENEKKSTSNNGENEKKSTSNNGENKKKSTSNNGENEKKTAVMKEVGGDAKIQTIPVFSEKTADQEEDEIKKLWKKSIDGDFAMVENQLVQTEPAITSDSSSSFNNGSKTSESNSNKTDGLASSDGLKTIVGFGDLGAKKSASDDEMNLRSLDTHVVALEDLAKKGLELKHSVQNDIANIGRETTEETTQGQIQKEKNKLKTRPALNTNPDAAINASKSDNSSISQISNKNFKKHHHHHKTKAALKTVTNEEKELDAQFKSELDSVVSKNNLSNASFLAEDKDSSLSPDDPDMKSLSIQANGETQDESDKPVPKLLRVEKDQA